MEWNEMVLYITPPPIKSHGRTGRLMKGIAPQVTTSQKVMIPNTSGT